MPVGECLMCGRDLYNEDDDHFWPDDYIETEDGLVCRDCWCDYGDKKMKEQRKEGRRN